MVKLSDETKNNIIKDLKNNISTIDIIKSRNVSKSTVFRINKELKNQDNTTINNTTINDITINDNKSNDFNLEAFKNELNNEDPNEESNEESNEELNNNEESNEESSEESIQTPKPRIIKPIPIPISLNESLVSKKSNILKRNNNIKFNEEPGRMSNAHSSRFEPKAKLSLEPIIDKSNILDTIKNCNVADSIEELKEIRSTVIIIRQYLNTFEKDLKNIWNPNKFQFEKKLFNLKLNELQVILENIRVEMNLSKNREMFNTLVSTSIIGLEKVSGYLGYHVDNLSQDLMKDESFQYDLKILQCEVDISRYINIKSSCFLKIIKTMYIKNQEYEMKNSLDKVINDENIINKIKDLDKK